MKYALITGGSRGIGAAAARLFARRGWGVAVGYCRSGEKAQALAEELSGLGVPALAVQADVAEEGQVGRMVDNVLEKFCQLDILLCAAGVSHLGLISQIDGDQWRRLFAVNVDGVHHCCRAVLWGGSPAPSSPYPPCGGRWGPPARRPIPPQKGR